MVNAILAKRVNHIVTKGDNPAWPKGQSRVAFPTGKDPDFLRKFNKSALEIVPWSFDKAMKHIFGEQVTTDSLWEEYQAFLKK